MTSRTVRLLHGRVSLRVRPRATVTGLAVTAAAVLTGVVAVRFGDPAIAFESMARVATGRAGFADAFVLVQLTLPRTATALLVGAALGVSGAIFQSLVRNPLGSPDVVGFNAGAATGAIAATLFLPAWPLGPGAVAVVSGLLTAALVYALAWNQGVRGYRLVLVGVGVTATLTAVNTYLLARAGLLAAQEANHWLYGSLTAQTWSQVALVAAALAVLLPPALVLGRRLDVLEMGDDTARALGVRVERTRLLLGLIATALPAVAVAVTGPVAFVALAAPQLVRRLTRAPGAHLGGSAAMGALLLVVADLVARHVLPGSDLPVGLATGALGGGYLAWLLAREWRRSAA